MSFTFKSASFNSALENTARDGGWNEKKIYDNVTKKYVCESDSVHYKFINNYYLTWKKEEEFSTKFNRWWSSQLKWIPCPENPMKDIFEEDMKTCIRYKEGGFMSKHKDKRSWSSTEWCRVIILAPKKSSVTEYNPEKRSICKIDCWYEGGDLVLYTDDGVKTFTGSEEEDVWTFVQIPFGTEHEVKPVTKGTRYVMKVNVNIPDIFKQVNFQKSTCVGEYHSLDEDSIAKKTNRITELKKELEILEREVNDYTNLNEVISKESEIMNSLGRGNVVAVILYNGYDDLKNLDSLSNCDKKFLGNIFKSGFEWSLVNRTLSCYDGLSSENSYYPSHVDCCPENLMEGYFGTDDREDESGHDCTIEDRMNKDFGENWFINRLGGEFGTFIEECSRYNDEYYSNFRLYQVSVLILKKDS